MKVLKTLRLTLVLLTLIGLVACGTGSPAGDDTGSTDGDSPPEGTEWITANVDPVPGAAPSALRIVTPAEEHTPDGSTGEQQFAVQPDRVGIAAAIDIERDFGWMAVTPAWFDDPTSTQELDVQARDTTVGPLSTAVTILFANPAFHHPDPDQAATIVAALADVPEVQAFADELARNADGADPFNEPSVLAAFETAYEAGVDALGDAAAATESSTLTAQGESSLTTQATTITIAEVDDDAVRFDADETASAIEPRWSDQYKRLTGERTATWIGRLYEIDEERATRATVDMRFFDRWNADFPVRLDAPDRRLRLNAEYSQAALALDPIGLSFDLLKAGMDFLPPPEVMEVDEGAYVSHMVTCILGFSGDNRSSDLTFLSDWNNLNDNVSRGDLGFACGQNIIEGGLDALGILPIDAGGILKKLADSGDDDVVNLVAEITGAALEASASADTWGSDDYLTLLYRFVKDGYAIVLENASRAGGESVADGLLGFLNFFGRVSSAAKTGARIGTMLRVTPLERHTIIVGNPWPDAGTPPTITSFEATPSSITKGESSTLAWSVEGDAPITLTIDNGVGDVTGSSTATVSPTTTTTYTLTATNAAGSTTSSTTVTVDEPGSTTRYTLTISTSGSGTVTSIPAGIDCGTTCTADFDDGTSVTLTPTPASGWTFDSWTGDADCTSGSVTMTAVRTCNATFMEVDAPSEVTFTAITAGGTYSGRGHSLALDANGNAWAWGHDGAGQLGDGGTNTDQATPVQVAMPTGVTFTTISAGEEGHSLALDTNGNGWAWGNDRYGQLGDGESNTNMSTPVQVAMPTGVTFTDISAGGGHSLALDQSGNAWSWGRDYSGELGDGGTRTNMTTPVQVTMPTDVTFTTIAAGRDHSLALDRNGNGWAWGYDGEGRLGDGWEVVNRSTPVQVIMPTGVTFTTIEAARHHSLALDQSGNAWAWGAGQLGHASSRARPGLVVAPSDVTFTTVTGGGSQFYTGYTGYSHALDRNGDGWAWGNDTYGQLGDGGTNIGMSTPVQITMPTDVSFTTITAGASHSLALDQNGNAWAWGNDSNGQLGDGGTNTNMGTPIQVAMP